MEFHVQSAISNYILDLITEWKIPLIIHLGKFVGIKLGFTEATSCIIPIAFIVVYTELH